MEPPLLNPELEISLNETARKRDGYFIDYQKSVGSALISIGAAISLCLEDKQIPVEQHRVLESLCDAGSLLADLHHHLTRSRRLLIIPSLDKKAKEVLGKSEPDKFLFGENLTENLKAVKSAERLGLALRTQPSQVRKPSVPTASENWRGPSRKGKYRAGTRPKGSNQSFGHQTKQSAHPKQNAGTFPRRNPA